MVLPKILVMTVTYSGKDYCFDEFIHFASKINYPNKKHIIYDNTGDNGGYANLLKERLLGTDIEVVHVERGNNTREALARCQETARRYALEEGYDYLYSLESDVYPPKDVIQKLIMANKPIVGSLYFIGKQDLRAPCITVKKQDPKTNTWGTRLIANDEVPKYNNKGIVPVQSCGMGSTLISRMLLEKHRFYYDKTLKGHSDIYFFNDVENSGTQSFIHTDIFCEHRNSEWSKIKDR